MDGIANWLFGFATDKEVVATFFAAFVGFGGVILTLGFQHRSSLHLMEEQERLASKRLAGAFGAELDRMIAYSAETASDLESQEYLAGRGGMHFPRRLPFVLGEALVGKLDLLEGAQVAAVLNCYLFAKDIPARLALLSSEELHSADYIFVPRVHAPICAQLMRSLEEMAKGCKATLSL